MHRHAIILLVLATAAPAWSATPAAGAQAEIDAWRKDLRQQGCSYTEVRGAEITATCPNSAGNDVDSRVNAAQCKGMDISLVNGRMACVGKSLGSRPARSQPRETAAPARAESRSASTLVLYSKASFGGRQSPEIVGPIEDLASIGFKNTAGSLVLRGEGSWQICDKAFFTGKCVVVSRSEDSLVKFGLKNDLTSVRPVR